MQRSSGSAAIANRFELKRVQGILKEIVFLRTHEFC